MEDGSTPLRIAFLTSAGTWRGSAVSTAHVVLGLNARGHQARMFVSEPDVASRARDRGIAVDLVPVRNTGPREVLTLRRLLHSTAIEVLVTDRPRDLRVAGYACLFSRVHLVNQFNLSRKDPPRDLSTRLACRRSQFTIFTTRRFARQVFAKAPFMSAVPWRIIGPAVDTKAFFRDDAAGRAFRTRYSLGDQPFVLAVGALVPEKRYDLILQSMVALGKDVPVLVVCGNGMQEEELRRLAQSLGVQVRWLGLVDAESLHGAYNAAMLLVHACAIETYGMSVAEALCCGTPVAAVDSGGIPEVVGDAGVLVPPDDAVALASALRALIADPDRRKWLSDAGPQRAAELLSLEAVINAWDSVMGEIRAGRRTRQ